MPSRRTTYFVVLGLVFVYGVVAIAGPFGIQSLLQKHREIRLLEEQNATLAQENRYRRERIERLRNNPDEQQLEIKKKLKLQRRGETTFILPEGSKDPAGKDAPQLVEPPQ
jgi:cell division protein FtsB